MGRLLDMTSLLSCKMERLVNCTANIPSPSNTHTLSQMRFSSSCGVGEVVVRSIPVNVSEPNCLCSGQWQAVKVIKTQDISYLEVTHGQTATFIARMDPSDACVAGKNVTFSVGTMKGLVANSHNRELATINFFLAYRKVNAGYTSGHAPGHTLQWLHKKPSNCK